ncbi:hypothetical protein LBMAG18_07610 [Alphaproteobacteria bacterium]|nr:hypothetical protein LBMAG18_07610 [Alphaproteobacteria bacterium]
MFSIIFIFGLVIFKIWRVLIIIKTKINKTQKIIIFFSTVVFSVFCSLNFLLANYPITPAGNSSTFVDNAPNAVKILNISSPNSSGVSHNLFSDFNVSQSGLIINNSNTGERNIVQSQLAGIIPINPNLQGNNSASLIINEVISGNLSQLNGFVEIAGQKSDLIIANPNGISINGAGFINVNNLNIVASKVNFLSNPNQTNANQIYFNFDNQENGNNIKISERGINLEEVNTTNFLASKIKINASIFAKENEVNLIASQKNFSYFDKKFDDNNLDNFSNKEFAIDAGNLTQIQGGKIFIIASDKGLGVNYNGDILSQKNGIKILSNGDIVVKNLKAIAHDIEISSFDGDVELTGNIATSQNADIKIIANNLINNAQVNSDKDMEIIAFNQIKNNKNNNFDYTLMPVMWANNIKFFTKNLVNDGKIIAKNSLIANGLNLENNGLIHGDNNLELSFDNNLLNNQTISNVKYLTNCLNQECYKIDLSELDLSNLAKTLNIFENDYFLKLTSQNFINNQRVLSDNLLTISALNLSNNLISSNLNSKNNIVVNALNFGNLNGLIQAKNNLEISNLKPDQISYLVINNNENKLANLKKIINQQQTNKNLFDNNNYYFFLKNSNSFEKSILANDISMDQSDNIFNDNYNFVINYTDNSIRANNLIKINLSNDQDLKIISAIKTSGDIEINAKDLSILSDITSNNSIKLNSSNSLTIGSINNKNRIVAGNEVKIIANNLFENYGHIDAGGNFNITVNSGDIVLDKFSKINGRQNTNYLQAINGKIIQNSLDLATNSDFIIKAQNFDNYGLISSYKDLTFEISDSLNNFQSSTIASKENINFNIAKNLINHVNADIYSLGNILIKGLDSLPQESLQIAQASLFENNSANVIAQNGYLKIYATDFKNIRKNNPFNALIDPLKNGPIGVYYTNDYPKNFGRYSWYFNNFGCFGHKCQEWYYGYYAKQLTNPDSISANIHSHDNFEFNGDNFTNQASNIYSNNNILINAKNFNNLAISDQGLYALRGVFSGDDDHTIIYSLAQTNFLSYNPGNGSHTGSYEDYNNFSQSFPAILKANRSIKIFANENIINSNFQEYSQTPIIQTKNINFVNNLDLENLFNQDSIGFNLSSYLSYNFNDSFFKINSESHKPLIETRLEFIDQNSYFASQYFYQKIGLDPNQIQKNLELKNIRLIGDQFFQNKIISDKLREINYDLEKSYDYKNSNEVIKTLIDNAASQKDFLNLTLDEALTKDQVDQVKSDMLWFEKESILGNNYLVPKLYLSKLTKKNIQNNFLAKSSINASENLDITSKNNQIINQGIIRGKNLNLEASKKIVNENFAKIEASQDLNIKVNNGSLINFSDIKAQENLVISASQDVINSALVSTNDNNLLNNSQFSGYNPYIDNFLSTKSVNTKSDLFQTASISGGNVEINAQGNFINQSAKINSLKNLSINADQNIIFDNLQLTNKEYFADNFAGKKFSQINSSTINLANDINAQGNINLIAKGINLNNSSEGIFLENERGNIVIKNSQIFAGKNLDIVAKNQIDITSALNYFEKIENNSSSSPNVKKQYFLSSSRIVNSPTQIEVLGNLKILSGSDVNIIASKIDVSQDGLIKTGYFTDLNPNSSTYLQEFINNNANLNIINGKDIEQKFSKLTTTKIGLSAENAMLTAVMVAAVVFLAPVSLPVVMVSAVAGGSIGSVNSQKNSKTHYSYQEKIVKSELNFGKNLSLISANDITIFGSKISDSLNQLNYQKLQTSSLANEGSLEIKPVNNLIISAVYQNNISQYTDKGKGNYFLKNGNSGYNSSKVINSEINLTSSSLDIDVGGKIYSSFAKEDYIDDNNLNYLKKFDPKITEHNFLENINHEYDKTSRGLTKAGSAVVSITVSAITANFLSGFQLIGSASSSSSSSAFSSATLSASSSNTSLTMTLSTSTSSTMSSGFSTTLSSSALSNTAMASGSLLNNALNSSMIQSTILSASQSGLSKIAISQALIHGINTATIAGISALASQASISTINNQGRSSQVAKNLTQSQSLKNLAITTLSAGISGTLSQLYQPSVIINNLKDNLNKLLVQTAIEGSSSLIAQAIITPENLIRNGSEQFKNSLVLGLAKIAANEIGQAYHHQLSPLRDSNGQYLTNLDGTILVSNSISKFEQLMLHASLGCLAGISLNNNCQTLASSAIVGELIGEQYRLMVEKKLVSSHVASLTPQLSGAINAIALNNLFQEDDDKLLRNINSSSIIAQNVAKENALQIMGHEVFANNNHLTIVHIPEPHEQAKYANKNGYVYDNQAGLWLKTWGAGPDNNFLSIFTNLTSQNITNLVSANNRERDIDLSIKKYKSPYLVDVNDEQKFVNLLDQLDKNYRDNLAYQIFPKGDGSGYNSNSYVAGLLNASNILPQDKLYLSQKYRWQAWEYDNSDSIDLEYRFLYNVPGYNKPISSNYFITN